MSTHMLPRSLHIPLLFYNKDLWTAGGLPFPSADWKWADMKAAAEQLAQQHGGSDAVYGLLDEHLWSVWNGELAGAGVAPDRPDELRLDDPKIATALEGAAALIRSGAIYAPIYARPNVGNPNPPDEIELIRNQRIGMWSPELCCYDPLTFTASFEIGVAPFPAPLFLFFSSVDGYSMSSGTQHPEAAWRWLSFLSHQEYSAGLQFSADTLPARRSIATRIGYWEKLSPNPAAVLKGVLENPAARQLIHRNTPALARTADLDPIVRAVVGGEQRARAALTAAQQAQEQRLAQQPLPTPTLEHIVVATPLPEAPAGTTTVVFGAPTFIGDQLRDIARAFNQNNSGVFVTVTETNAGSGLPTFTTLARTTDCFADFRSPPQAEVTATLDLQPLIDADADFQLDDYYPVLIAPFRHDGQLYGLPHEVYLRMLMYNQSAFDAAGISHPTAAWTLDDLLHAAQQLTRGAGAAKQYGFAAPFSSWREVFFILDRFGALATRGGGAALAPNFNDPMVQQAIRFYLDLLRNYSPHTHLTDYARDTIQPNNAGELIDAGRVGMWFSFGVDRHDMRGWTLAVAAPPGLRTTTPNDFIASGLYISARTRQRAACWEWLKYLSRDRSTLQGAFPARRSPADNEAAALPTGTTGVYQAYRAALDRLASVSAAPPDRSAMDYYWFIRAMDRALAGQDLERELADAQTLTEQYLACVRGGATARMCAMQVDPDYQGFAGP